MSGDGFGDTFEVTVRTHDSVTAPGEGPMSENDRTPQQLRHENEQLRRRVAALEAVEERFRATFEQAVVGMAHVGLDGGWLRVNQRMCDIVGYSREELVERTFQSLTHPDDLAGDVGALQKLISGELRKYTREKRYVRKDGSVVWIFLVVTLARNASGEPAYFVSVTEDIDERKRIEADLKASEETHRTLFASSRDAIMTLAPPSWKFTSGNPATIKMFGARDEADLVARAPWEYSPAEQPGGRPSADAAREMIETAMATGSHFFEWMHKRLGGGAFPATVLLTRMEIGGQALLTATVRDITEQRRLEDSLRLTQFSVDTTADAILWIRPDASLAYANDSMCRLLGYSREEMLDLKVFDIDGAHTPETWRRRWEDARQKQTLSVQTVHRRKDGTTVPVEISSNYVELQGTARMCSFIRDISERKRTEEELFRLATTDSLTGALNRRYFNERCGQEIHRSKRYGGCLSALMLDLDHFKRINDTSGHAAGDEVLRAFARLCAAQLRVTDLFGRLGGEEFAVALPGTSFEGAVVVAERLRKAISEAVVEVNGTEIRFTVSVGVTEWATEDRTMDDVHRRADEAMYEAKGQGRNRVVVRRRDAG
jgi:diguanylate cyclase (GGDEF)-like protein/PAS domain S-box-containing protein